MTEYHNPQQDPGSERRLLLAFLLVFALIAAMQFLVRKQQPPAPQEKPAAQPQGQTQMQATPAVPAATPVPRTTKATAAVPKIPARQAAAESHSVLENDVYRVVLSNRGGVAQSWVLKHFKDNDGNPLDLVNKSAAAALGYPLSLFLYDKDLEKRVNEALYVATSTDGGQGFNFEYSDGTVSVRKAFRIRENAEKNYVLDVETEVTNNGQRVQAFPQWPSGMGDQSTLASYTNGKIDWEQEGKTEHKAAVSGNFITGKKYISNGQTVSGPFEWAGTADQYFAAVFMPASPRDTAVIMLNNSIELPRDPKKPDEGQKDKVSVIGVAAGSTTGLTRVRLFAGPKTVDVLERTQAQPGVDLRGLTDFGMFSFIARPLFIWLRWTYEHWIPNWGWSIAFLTVVITMALLPLRISSMKSSLKMQKIQPQMKALQEKYKRFSLTDPRRAEMQKEMQELYRREGVNPIGGCLPLLLQMPFLFAFYSMLANAIELRQAGWWWVHDLSAPDPLHILPIIIIVLMFLSQRSMPQAGMDPAQQKMLTFMGPVMFGFLSWNTPAGLSVYWAISTLLGYVQQIIINRSALGQQVRKSMERRSTRKK